MFKLLRTAIGIFSPRLDLAGPDVSTPDLDERLEHPVDARLSRWVESVEKGLQMETSEYSSSTTSTLQREAFINEVFLNEDDYLLAY